MGNKNLMEDKSIERFKQLAGLQEDEVAIGFKDFEDRWELMDTILKYMEPDELVVALLKAMGREDAEEYLDYIARMHDIYYHEEVAREE